ncbi:F-box/FBD/LRR-repeat protein At1g13570-like isoform X2 [Miscanthus floridulus]|uniref:F-box/FBD/LRR-repeat protein At1g13570-like isoform X2 n=1 Tax=Miscanthus floridulus TaxID=154761 RepID=UPI00345744FF
MASTGGRGIMEEIFACIPTQPIPSPAEGSVSAAACSVVGEAEADEDRISRLADALLSNIVSRLPIKDAARTAALSPRWRRVWASTPLVLDDAHLLPDPDEPDGPLGFGTDWRSIADAVSSVLAAHPGPFHCVRLTNVCSYAAARDRGALARDWLRVVAEKGVDDLVLVCPRWPLKAKIPADILRVASLRSLYLGLWDEFPGSTKSLRRGNVAFPHLVELGLCRTDIKTADIDHLLQCSPLLEKLALVACDNSPDCVRVRSRSLRCVLFWMSVANEVNVLVVPRLERLILWSECPGARLADDFRTRLNIGYVQELKVLGYLDLRIHVLEISNTIIEAGRKPSPRTIVPSVHILALKVRFGVRKEARMLPSYLRCFPNVVTLHIMSDEADEPTGKLNFKFWQEAGPISCLESQIKRVVFKNFRGDRSELAFLRFIWERAQLLHKMVIVLADGDDPASLEQMVAKLKPLACAKRASKDRKLTILIVRFERKCSQTGEPV